MKRGFRLTPEASADLREILLDIAADSPETAERLRIEILEALRRLGQHPGIGHYHGELMDRRYRSWNFYSYVVCYVWEKEPIEIVALVHGARDLAAFLPARLNLD